MDRDYLLKMTWPPKELSPNSRKDRRGTTDKRKKFKSDWFWICKEAGAEVSDDATLEITFHPPDNRKRDLDNMLSSIKYGLDGIAAAAGVDDCGWGFTIRKGEKVTGGAILVHIRGDE